MLVYVELILLFVDQGKVHVVADRAGDGNPRFFVLEVADVVEVFENLKEVRGIDSDPLSGVARGLLLRYCCDERSGLLISKRL